MLTRTSVRTAFVLIAAVFGFGLFTGCNARSDALSAVYHQLPLYPLGEGSDYSVETSYPIQTAATDIRIPGLVKVPRGGKLLIQLRSDGVQIINPHFETDTAEHTNEDGTVTVVTSEVMVYEATFNVTYQAIDSTNQSVADENTYTYHEVFRVPADNFNAMAQQAEHHRTWLNAVVGNVNGRLASRFGYLHTTVQVLIEVDRREEDLRFKQGVTLASDALSALDAGNTARAEESWALAMNQWQQIIADNTIATNGDPVVDDRMRASAHYNIAVAHTWMNRYPEAIAAIQRAIAVNSTNRYRGYLAHIQDRQRRWEANHGQ